MELRPRKLIQEERRCEHSSEQYFPERDGLPSKTNSLPQQTQMVVSPFATACRVSCSLRGRPNVCPSGYVFNGSGRGRLKWNEQTLSPLGSCLVARRAQWAFSPV